MITVKIMQALFTMIDNLATSLYQAFKKTVQKTLAKKEAKVRATQERFERNIHDAMTKRDEAIKLVKDAHDKTVEVMAERTGNKLMALDNDISKLEQLPR